eukprot:gene22830-7008_t
MACTVHADRTGRYHPALDTFSISNEPDLFASGVGLAKAMLSALDGVVSAERAAGRRAQQGQQ